MDNLSAVRQAVANNEIDAILLKESNNRFYATGFRSSEGTVLITRTDAFFFTDSRYIEAAENTITGASVRLTNGKNKIWDLLNSLISDQGIRKLGIEEECLTYSEYLKIDKELATELVPAQSLLRISG
jgi:Xaa-Pro aminopeptidase